MEHRALPSVLPLCPLPGGRFGTIILDAGTPLSPQKWFLSWQGYHCVILCPATCMSAAVLARFSFRPVGRSLFQPSSFSLGLWQDLQSLSSSARMIEKIGGFLLPLGVTPPALAKSYKYSSVQSTMSSPSKHLYRYSRNNSTLWRQDLNLPLFNSTTKFKSILISRASRLSIRRISSKDILLTINTGRAGIQSPIRHRSWGKSKRPNRTPVTVQHKR